MTLKSVAIVSKNDPGVQSTAVALERWLVDRGAMVRMKISPSLSDQAPEDLSSVFVLGGDGTFLGAVRWLGGQPIPIIGAKFGEVGFLADIAGEDLFTAAAIVLNGAFTIEKRMQLSIRVFQADRLCAHETVLNDVVINKGALARLANITTSIDGQYLTTFRADGLIVATPTGSTAYALAAGGPIVHPAVPGIILAPICPFTLTNRPLIIPDSSTIEIKLSDRSEAIMVTFDGQSGFKIDETHRLVINRSDSPVHIIRLDGHNYFNVLKTKLRWSGGRF